MFKLFKKKSIIFLCLLLFVGCMILSGCSNGNNENKASVKANTALSNLIKGICEEDEGKIAGSISKNGVKIINNISGDSFTYTKDEICSELKGDPSALLIFNLLDRTIQTNNNTVIISRETSTSLILFDIFQMAQPMSIDESSAIPGTQKLHDVKYFSITYPDNWLSVSIPSYLYAISVAIAEKGIIASVLYSKDFIGFYNFTLDQLINEIKNSLDEYSDIDLISFESSDNDKYSSAKKYTVHYNYSYNPTLVEITFQKEEGNYKITQIKISQSSSRKTVSLTETGNIIKNNNDLYLVTYGGFEKAFNFSEANKIFDSFIIKN